MDLLDRYLQAIRFWLPRRTQEDIVRELAEDIRSEIEEREAQSGHALGDADLEAILLRRGAPRTVALRYFPNRYLIGPLLLPIYGLVLRVVLLWVLLPLTILVSASAVATSADPGIAALAAAGRYLQSAISGFAMITLVFAILERVQPDYPTRKAWNPRDLPKVRPPERDEPSRTGSAFEVIFGGWFLLWWSGLIHSPILGLPLDSLVHLTPAPVWLTLHWPILALSVSMTVLSAVNLVCPWWTFWRAVTRLSNQVVAVGLAAWLLHAGTWFTVTASALPPGKIADIQRSLNLGLPIAFFWISAFAAISVIFHDLPRLRRLARTRSAASAPAAP